jgi:hypothetical protein
MWQLALLAGGPGCVLYLLWLSGRPKLIVVSALLIVVLYVLFAIGALSPHSEGTTFGVIIPNIVPALGPATLVVCDRRKEYRPFLMAIGCVLSGPFLAFLLFVILAATGHIWGF